MSVDYKITQLVVGYQRGNGVSNVAASIKKILDELGYDSPIFNRYISWRDIENDCFDENDVVLYHMSIKLDPMVKYLKCHKILVFHNITEPCLVEGIEEEQRMFCEAGWYETGQTADIFSYAITFSEYSKRCLIEAGWEEERVFVIPILLRFDHFNQKHDTDIINKYIDHKGTKILFTGRLFPNKKQENIISIFAEYKKKYDDESLLFLIGAPASEGYHRCLIEYAKEKEVEDAVVFGGHVSFAEYLAYYKVSDLFLCMSEHEGFCIPLIEAMYFGLPIVAKDTTAIGDTLAGAGVLVDTSEPVYVADVINRILHSDERKRILSTQAKRMEQLSAKQMEKEYQKLIADVVKKSVVEIPKVHEIDSFRKIYHKHNLLFEQIDRIYAYSEENVYVIYGAGAYGHVLYEELKGEQPDRKIYICDKNKGGRYDDFISTEVWIPEDIISRYKDAVFIISIQSKDAIFMVLRFLSSRGVDIKKIYCYDAGCGRIS